MRRRRVAGDVFPTASTYSCCSAKTCAACLCARGRGRDALTNVLILLSVPVGMWPTYEALLTLISDAASKKEMSTVREQLQTSFRIYHLCLDSVGNDQLPELAYRFGPGAMAFLAHDTPPLVPVFSLRPGQYTAPRDPPELPSGWHAGVVASCYRPYEKGVMDAMTLPLFQQFSTATGHALATKMVEFDSARARSALVYPIVAMPPPSSSGRESGAATEGRSMPHMAGEALGKILHYVRQLKPSDTAVIVSNRPDALGVLLMFMDHCIQLDIADQLPQQLLYEIPGGNHELVSVRDVYTRLAAAVAAHISPRLNHPVAHCVLLASLAGDHRSLARELWRGLGSIYQLLFPTLPFSGLTPHTSKEARLHDWVAHMQKVDNVNYLNNHFQGYLMRDDYSTGSLAYMLRPTAAANKIHWSAADWLHKALLRAVSSPSSQLGAGNQSLHNGSLEWNSRAARERLGHYHLGHEAIYLDRYVLRDLNYLPLAWFVLDPVYYVLPFEDTVPNHLLLEDVLATEDQWNDSTLERVLGSETSDGERHVVIVNAPEHPTPVSLCVLRRF